MDGVLSQLNPVHNLTVLITLSLRRILILSYCICLGLGSCLFPSGFPTKILHAYVNSPGMLHGQTVWFSLVRFRVLTAASMKMTVFCDVALCRLAEVHRRFRGACCLHHQGPETSVVIFILLDLIAIIIFGKECKLWMSSYANVSALLLLSPYLGPTTHLRTLFSNTVLLCNAKVHNPTTQVCSSKSVLAFTTNWWLEYTDSGCELHNTAIPCLTQERPWWSMNFRSPHDWRETGARMSTCAHSQEIVPLFNSHFSVVYWPGDYTDHCITLYILFTNLLISPRINFKHPGQNTRYQLTMTQRSVAKTYAHLINVKHVQVPLYQSRGLARGEFSTPLFTSGSFLGETRYTMFISGIVTP
jgi:hypothetical protein